MTEIVELSKLKTWLMLDDDSQDDLLKLIIEMTTQAMRRKLSLGTDEEFPEEMSDIVFNVCVKRYNRLKNEGMNTYSQEGETISFNSNDFEEFKDDINDWKLNHADLSSAVSFYNPYE